MHEIFNGIFKRDLQSTNVLHGFIEPDTKACNQNHEVKSLEMLVDTPATYAHLTIPASVDEESTGHSKRKENIHPHRYD